MDITTRLNVYPPISEAPGALSETINSPTSIWINYNNHNMGSHRGRRSPSKRKSTKGLRSVILGRFSSHHEAERRQSYYTCVLLQEGIVFIIGKTFSSSISQQDVEVWMQTHKGPGMNPELWQSSSQEHLSLWKSWAKTALSATILTNRISDISPQS